MKLVINLPKTIDTTAIENNADILTKQWHKELSENALPDTDYSRCLVEVGHTNVSDPLYQFIIMINKIYYTALLHGRIFTGNFRQVERTLIMNFGVTELPSIINQPFDDNLTISTPGMTWCVENEIDVETNSWVTLLEKVIPKNVTFNLI